DGKESVVTQSVHPAARNQLPGLCQENGNVYFYARIGFAERFDARTGMAAPAGTDSLKLPASGYGGRAFSPDCRSIYFPRVLDRNRRSITKVELATGDRSELLADGGDFVPMAYVSPDGRWLAFKGNLPGRAFGVILVPADGGPPRMLDEYA